MKMIKLTNQKDLSDIWVNPNHISYMFRDDKIATTIILNGVTTIRVTEKPEVIEKKIWSYCEDQ